MEGGQQSLDCVAFRVNYQRRASDAAVMMACNASAVFSYVIKEMQLKRVVQL
jgi:hypothetical protein